MIFNSPKFLNVFGEFLFNKYNTMLIDYEVLEKELYDYYNIEFTYLNFATKDYMKSEYIFDYTSSFLYLIKNNVDDEFYIDLGATMIQINNYYPAFFEEIIYLTEKTLKYSESLEIYEISMRIHKFLEIIKRLQYDF